jgi:DnaJ family protein C protein 7
MSAMDIDREPVNGASNPSSPNPSAQANFSVPIPNGTTHDEPPAPPPHGSNPSSPVPSVMEEAEGYKAQGNKFFKDKSYKSAIEYYTKGNVSPLPSTWRYI